MSVNIFFITLYFEKYISKVKYKQKNHIHNLSF